MQGDRERKMGDGKGFFTLWDYIECFEKNMTVLEREEYFNLHIGRYQSRWLAFDQQYFKEILKGSEDRRLYIMYWAPKGMTRPHQHIYEDKGAPATIYILRGGLSQELYAIFDEGYERLEKNEFSAGEEICEEPNSLHAIGNSSAHDWAVSIHEFVPGFKMRVYDFNFVRDGKKGRQWIVDGKEDTLGDPPESATPIWPRVVADN